MNIVSKPLRYAHAEGHTDICYSEDGQHIITCGHDGDVRIWLDIEDDNPNSHCVGETATAVCFKDRRLYVATDNHAVQAYTFPAFDKDGIVTRFTAAVTQIIATSKIEALGCTSENMEARICSPEGGAPLFVMSEHNGPVLSMAICPQMKYAATACGDGFLRIWDIDMQKMIKDINCVPKINTFYSAKVLCKMDFEPSERKFLAYPNNREIILIDCESWGQRMNFTHNLIKCAISQCLFSPCGQYLCGSTVAGQIAVWEVESGNCMGITEHPTSHNVSAMAWNPKGNGILAYCDVAGQLGMLENCYGKESRANAAEDDVEMVERADDNDDLLDNLVEAYESDDENAISLEKLKNETLKVVSDGEESRSTTTHGHYAAPSTVPPQPPFQPSATPTHLEHRYMCWNEVGIIRCHNVENESNIEVEFHDTNVHHGIHLKNYLNHTIASLSTSVLALACESPSKIVCISLVGNSKEWIVTLPDLEEALCVVATAALVACATTARLLRLFTAMGTQRQVISLPGPIVSLAGYDSTVFAVYHSNDPGVADQHLSMDIIAMHGRQLRSKTIPVPLSPRSRLTWVGSTECGSPCTYDSAGILRLYDVTSGIWLPICDTNIHSKGASDSWFIVSICESTQSVRAILCRGATFPLTAPKPIVTELPIRMALCSVDSEQGELEEKLVRWAHIAAEVDVKTARETALKLFALACRSEIEQRALELMDLLKDERLLPLAAKYASRLGRVHLADKLTNLAETWEKDTDKASVGQHFVTLDTQESYDVSNSEEMNSSIIPQKVIPNKVFPAPAIRPALMTSSPTSRNPFKKQQQNSKTVLSPLTLTERTLVATPQIEENTDPLKPINGETFVDWFSRNKTTLEEQNLDLTPAELTRHCIKTFKSLQIQHNTNGTEIGQKRKLDDANGDVLTTVTSAPKQSKLSSFAFQKKP